MSEATLVRVDDEKIGVLTVLKANADCGATKRPTVKSDAAEAT
jgi:hypothetical protein